MLVACGFKWMAQKSQMCLLHVPLQTGQLTWRAVASLSERGTVYSHTCLGSTEEADYLPAVRNYWRCCQGPCGCQRAHGGLHLSHHAICHSKRSSLSLHPQLCPHPSERQPTFRGCCAPKKGLRAAHTHMLTAAALQFTCCIRWHPQPLVAGL